MEGSSSSSAPVVLNQEEVDQTHKSVQELVNNELPVPDEYLCKDSPYGPITSSLPFIDIPVIDLKRLPTTEDELQKLRSALCSLGCFQVINHGMEFGVLNEVDKVGREFFHLPMEEKQKYGRPDDDVEGYGTDVVLSEDQTLDWTDRLYLLVTPENGRNFQFWPQNPQDFRKILHEYTEGVKHVSKILLQSAAKILDLSENSFLEQCGEQQVTYCRFNFYPTCPKPEQTLGLKAHTDGSAITIVLPDKQVEGLQLLKDNQWFKVPLLISSALLVNAGDFLEIMSNGIYKSPMHRAVTNSEKERMSVAMFWGPELENEIKPLEGLISEERPRMFNTLKDYPLTYYKYYQENKKALEALRIY